MGRDSPQSPTAVSARRRARRVASWVTGVPGVAVFAVVLALAVGTVLDHRGARRDEPAPPPRPEPAAAGREREVSFANGAIRHAGTLTLPPGPGPFPAAFLITGSGAQDRDAELFGHRRHRVLAEALAGAGVAALRADDRGVGGSSGDLALATQADLAADAWAAVRFLRDQPEIDRDRIGLYGASQGSTIAALAAVEHPDEVAFVVLAACIARPLREVFVIQHVQQARAVGLPESTVREVRATVEEVVRVILSEAPDERKRTRLRPLAEQLASSMRGDPMAGLSPFGDSVERAVASALTPSMRDLMAYDPGPVLARLRAPALLLGGGLDLQVDAAANLALAGRLLESGGHPDFEVALLPGLNHFLQPAKTGLPGEYGEIAVAYAPEALDRITGWVAERFVEPQAEAGTEAGTGAQARPADESQAGDGP